MPAVISCQDAGPPGPSARRSKACLSRITESLTVVDRRGFRCGRPEVAEEGFSRPGLQEPERGLPGQAGENPSGRS